MVCSYELDNQMEKHYFLVQTLGIEGHIITIMVS